MAADVNLAGESWSTSLRAMYRPPGLLLAADRFRQTSRVRQCSKGPSSSFDEP
jgi:hypothetical protein